MEMEFSILMPAFNEGRHIYRNLKETGKVLSSLGRPAEIVVVDDGSTDNTLAEIKRAASEIELLKYYSRPVNRGKGWALKKAFELSCGRWIFFLDSDLDIHPRQFQTLLATQVTTGAGIVIGSKRHPASTLRYPFSRRVISAAYFALVKLLFGLPIRDTQTGIKLFHRPVLEKILPRILVKKYAFDLEVLVNAHHQGYRVAEAPVVVEFQGRFGRIGLSSILTILNDTLAVFYRLKFLKYYDRPLIYSGREPLVSILIPFSRPRPRLEQCLEGIKSLNYPSREVILLPDEPMEERGEGIRIIPTGKMLPPVKRDIGWKQCRGEIVAFIDDDAYPEEGWLKNAVRHFGDEKTAAVGGPASTPPGENFWSEAGGIVMSSRLVAGVHIHRYVPKIMKEVDDHPTSNLLVRKSDLEAVEGFDTPFWPGEDTILCFKLTHQLGKKIVYDPDVQVWHHPRPLFRPLWKQVGDYGLHRGYFAKRYPRTSRRLSYFIPSLWTLFLFLGWIPLMFIPGGWWIYLSLVGIYLLAAVLVGAKSLDLSLASAVAAGVISTHVVYGVAFIRGLFSSGLPEE